MRALLALPLLLASGCATPAASDPGVVCTMEFRTVTVRVVDETGTPLTDLASESVVAATGAVLAEDTDPGLAAEGVYLVATDSDLDALSPDGSDVRFTATSDTWRATASFDIAGGPCHIEKRSGPEEVVAERR